MQKSSVRRRRRGAVMCIGHAVFVWREKSGGGSGEEEPWEEEGYLYYY